MPKVFVEPIGVTVEIADGDSLLDATASAAVDARTDCHGRGTCGKCLVRMGAGGFSEPTEVEFRRIPDAKLARGLATGLPDAIRSRPRSASRCARRRAGAASRPRRSCTTATRSRPSAARWSQFEPGLAPRRARRRGAGPRPARRRRRAPLGRAAAARRAARRRLQGPGHALRRRGHRHRAGRCRPARLRRRRRRRHLQDHRATSSTWPPVARSTRRPSRTRRCATARTSSRASPRPCTAASGPSSRAPCARASTGCWPPSARARRSTRDQVYDMTVVGNTVMHHLALGLSPVGMAAAPFAPALAEPVTVRAADLGIAMNPEGGVHFPPPIAGFVGSDALAVIAATRLAAKRRPALARHRHQHRDRRGSSTAASSSPARLRGRPSRATR